MFQLVKHYTSGGIDEMRSIAKPVSGMETVNDLDSAVVDFWRVLRDRPQDLERVCALTPHARAEHHLAYEPAGDDLERARRIWVLLTRKQSAAGDSDSADDSDGNSSDDDDAGNERRRVRRRQGGRLGKL